MKLAIHRGRIVPFEEMPDRAIALDGYVQGPAIDPDRERYSFDHHAGCVRHATRATSEQVRDAITLGLDPTDFHVLINDVDLDTALSVWLLANPHRVGEPIVDELVSGAGLLDAHCGAYPIEHRTRAVVEWLSEPETTARANGTYWGLDDHGLSDLLGDISRRIDVYTRGEASPAIQNFGIDERYEVEREGDGWVLARTIGTRAHAAVFRDGHLRAVIYRQLPDGTWGYTIAKKSEFVKHFPVPEILKTLSLREEGWGGGSTIGGAPRHPDGSRSRLSPDVVFELVDAVVRQQGRAPRNGASAAAVTDGRPQEQRAAERTSSPPPSDG